MFSATLPVKDVLSKPSNLIDLGKSPRCLSHPGVSAVRGYSTSFLRITFCFEGCGLSLCRGYNHSWNV